MVSALIDELIVSDESGFACSKSKLVAEGLLQLRPFNISDDGNLVLSEQYQVPASEAPRGKSSLEVGDILFNNTNSLELVGKSVLISDAMIAGYSNHLTRIRVDNTRVEPAFFAYWLRKMRSTGYFSANATQWVSQAAYKTSELRKLTIELPSIPEQRRIVDLLSRAEGIVRLRHEAEQKAAELIPALFLDMFGDPATNSKGWPVASLGELIADGPKNGLYKHSSLYGEGTPILRIDGFYDGRVEDLKALRRVRISHEEQEQFGLSPHDIVINRVNSPEYLGKSAIIPQLEEATVFESNMMRFSVDERRVLPEYVIHLLQTGHAKAHFLAKAKHAINQSSINQQDVKSLSVLVPPLEVQEEFVVMVEQVRSIQTQQADGTANAQATFDALLAQIFNSLDAQ